MYKLLLLIILLVTSTISLYSQKNITGTVTDSKGVPLSGSSVTYGSKRNSSIAGFALSGTKGEYSLQVNLPGDSLKVKVSYIGFETQVIMLKNASQQHDFQLIYSYARLKEVKVKSPPIYQRKDTVNYNVASFTAPQDRVIGDILKKLPGVEVKPEGQIFYQGKAIQQLTVNGLNLMEGRYGIVTNNLPAVAVSKVQVVENDQPIKVLDSLVHSDRASINLKLKKFTTTGNAKVGIGLLPFLRDINLTAMTFDKNWQSINSFMSNNTGNDAARQLRGFSSGSYMDNDEGITALNSLTGIMALPSPPFDMDKWLDNNLNLLTTNLLRKLSKDWEMKANIGYVNDNQQQYGATLTSLMTGNQTVKITESKQNTYNSNHLLGNYIVQKNVKKMFFRNNLSMDKKWLSDLGNLLNNNNPVYQQKNYQYLKLDNRLNMTTIWGKQLITINSQVNYAALPENLSVTPGPFPGALNDSIDYDKAIQQVYAKSFSTNNYLAFIKGVKRFTFSPKAGISYNSNTLISKLHTYKGSAETQLGNGYTNDIVFRQATVYAEMNTSFQSGNWKVELKTPLSFTDFKISNNLSTDKRKVLFQPNLNAEYYFGARMKMTVSSGRSDQFGDLGSLYNAFILTGYRTLQQQNPYLAESVNYNNDMGMEYKDVMSNLLFNIHFNQGNAKNNILYRTTINPNGTSVTNAILQDNNQSGKGMSAEVSKLVAGIKTLFKLTGRMYISKSEQVINNELFSVSNNSWIVQGTINGNFSKYFTSAYMNGFSYTKSRLSDNNFQEGVHQQEHHLELNVFPVSNQMISAKTDYYSNNLTGQKDQFFLNLLYRFTFTKRKIDLDLGCNNILNTNYFTSFYNDGYTSVQNSYRLRKRQVLISFRITL